MRATLVLAISAAVLQLSTVTPEARADALEDCWARSDSRIELGDCLRTLKETLDDEMAELYVRARNAQAEVDDFVGQRQASRTIERAQKAFELYRDLECHLRELQAGSGTGSGDFYLGCWIDLTRARIERLESLLPEEAGAVSPLGSWSVAAVMGKEPLPDVPLSVTFEDDTKISGDGGCNRFFGPVRFDSADSAEGGIEIGPLGATRKACGQMIDEQEAFFLAALAQARRFTLEGESLMLLSSDGMMLARLSRAE